MNPPISGDIQIRPCTAADAPALSELAKRCFDDTFRGTCSPADMIDFLDTYYSEARLEAELQRKDEFTFFAESDGKPVAYLRVCHAEPPFNYPEEKLPLELSRLYVDQSFQGKGVAGKLMDLFLEHAKTTGLNYLWLGVWEHNFRAQAFYRRYGFQFTGHKHPFPIGNTPQTDEWWALDLKS